MHNTSFGVRCKNGYASYFDKLVVYSAHKSFPRLVAKSQKPLDELLLTCDTCGLEIVAYVDCEGLWSSQQQPPQIPIQESSEASQEGKQLVSLFTEMEHKQLDFLDELGKSIIERVSALLAVLFAVTAFSNTFSPAYLKGNMTAKVLVIVTLILYLLALGAGLWGIQPRYYKRYMYNVIRLADELEKIKKHKMLWLRIAECFLRWRS